MAHKKRISTVMVVNDDPEFLELMKQFLTDEGYEVGTIPKHQGAFEQIRAAPPDLLVCDIVFGSERAGFLLLDKLSLDPATADIPIVLCSAATDVARQIEPSLAAKGIRWLEKPFRLEALLELLASLNTDER